jgi:hypothetical protein
MPLSSLQAEKYHKSFRASENKIVIDLGKLVISVCPIGPVDVAVTLLKKARATLPQGGRSTTTAGGAR